VRQLTATNTRARFLELAQNPGNQVLFMDDVLTVGELSRAMFFDARVLEGCFEDIRKALTFFRAKL
jgi:hypothetical protein